MTYFTSCIFITNTRTKMFNKSLEELNIKLEEIIASKATLEQELKTSQEKRSLVQTQLQEVGEERMGLIRDRENQIGRSRDELEQKMEETRKLTQKIKNMKTTIGKSGLEIFRIYLYLSIYFLIL